MKRKKINLIDVSLYTLEKKLLNISLKNLDLELSTASNRKLVENG